MAALNMNTDLSDLKNDGDGMTNIEILNQAQHLGLPNFKYFMSNELTKSTPDIKKNLVLLI